MLSAASCFAVREGTVEQLTQRLQVATAHHFSNRLKAIRKAIDVSDAKAASANLLELWARWSPNALAGQIALAMELAALLGREEVFAEMGEDAGFALALFQTELRGPDFREQIAYLRQKRPAATKVWTDAMRGDHDRSFVVAGATETALLEDFHAAVLRAAKTWDRAAFAKDFDEIVAKHGWQHNGSRNFRIRTIFETNLRTSYMAGRLRQMRDPAVVKLRPYWQYVHAETRVPKNPRPLHLGWDGLVLMHDDPWWNIHFPPNDWLCSCGVRTLSELELKRLGKTGPDAAPPDKVIQEIDKLTGEFIERPRGIGRGWDYMPGDLWERGLVPSQLIEEAGGVEDHHRHLVQIDKPEPIVDLLAHARPFAASPIFGDGLAEEDYVRAFLQPFGADLGRAVLFEDVTGVKIPISDELFRDRSGRLKVTKRDREIFTPLFAETIMDPDEIWIGVAEKKNAVNPTMTDYFLDRRYIRADNDAGLIAVFEMTQRWWQGATTYVPADRKGIPSSRALDARRGGKLVWKRKR